MVDIRESRFCCHLAGSRLPVYQENCFLNRMEEGEISSTLIIIYIRFRFGPYSDPSAEIMQSHRKRKELHRASKRSSRASLKLQTVSAFLQRDLIL